jgi:hypothetical protein
MDHLVNSKFNEQAALRDLKHYLPAQAPLRDFIQHNTLHAFQNLKFKDAIWKASVLFGYKVSLSLSEYRALYAQGRIRNTALDKVITDRKGSGGLRRWKEKLINKKYSPETSPRIGSLRANWKRQYKIDLDAMIHPTLFRILGSFLDQGISIWSFPVSNMSFLDSIIEIEKKSYTSFFKTQRARKLFLGNSSSLKDLLTLVVGDEKLYTQYLFDQQFAHQGWSGMVSTIEDHPQSLLDQKKISLHDLIIFELLLEIDSLDYQFDTKWVPLAQSIFIHPKKLFDPVIQTELHEVLTTWQEAFEWNYFDQVLGTITVGKNEEKSANKSFQAIFCIDDRECSLRRHLEKVDSSCETFGTPGFFNVEFYFQPAGGRFVTKVCPAPLTPKYLIKGQNTQETHRKDFHFTDYTHSLIPGALITRTIGFWSAFKLAMNIFRPSMGPVTTRSFRHMDHLSDLTIENTDLNQVENGLQVGFTVNEMVQRVESLFMSIGLVKNFAPLVYIIGHGSTSINNPYYAAYDCGACSGRPGSVNAQVFSFMANHSKVRELLREKGIDIPDTTQFIGGLHDISRDEVSFYDEASLSVENSQLHKTNVATFKTALDQNAKERSRRFESAHSKLSAEKNHKEILTRSVSLFEPRPELNHATNAVTIVGRRALSKGIFLDRRSFLNSYDYQIDPTGKYLFHILKAAAPVCGGVNLEYYFSRVDNNKLGASTKLPHNVMGLIGVANGIEGDLRPGLPRQMIEVHDPMRMLFIVEHFPEVVLDTIQQAPEIYEWFINEWVHLVVINPKTQELTVFKEGYFTPYTPTFGKSPQIYDFNPLFELHQDDLPVYSII